MCGISGIVYKNKQSNKADIKNINNLIKHRGPDDEGYFYSDNFTFGHRRLSILDLSDEGHQPMSYVDKYTIVYNGEIYNYLEIREELLSDGYCFKSATDTEVILASYDKWGESCVDKFNGMWAFSIYDKEKNTLFCSRDRFGIKPFYYTQVDDKFVFGSEIKQLLEFYPQNFVNKKILLDYLVIGFEDHTNETFFENIFKLEQSHNLIYNLNTYTYKIKRYYDITVDQSVNELNSEDSIKIYEQKLYDSIKLRLRSDVKVGTCLSGGLDSSSIASIASKIYHEQTDNKFTAIHAKSTQSDNDESKFAQDVSEYCNLNLKILEPSKSEFISKIDEVIYTQEEPFGGVSIFMQYFVMQEAKEQNCKVMLDGQGGDEILLGYERYYPAYLISLNLFELVKGFFNVSKNSKLSIKQLISYIGYFTSATIRTKRLKEKNNFIKREYLELIDSDLVKKNSDDYLNIFNLQYGEIYKTQMPHLLRYEDKNSMRHSVETRLPFVDVNLLEASLSIDNCLKIKDGWSKYILRKVIENKLPKNIVWRKNKFGFEAPVESWLNSIENEMFKSINESKIINFLINKKLNFKKLDEKQKWKLFNIAKWEEIYNVSIN
ncbi:MAG: asparagine synthase (glutamine-hydrolyzing) [Epsilonproteobacteria bacterium]|nr:MAG: asparagine synthase (glutamine-hydrolyzing) [Campylobacterota bacterium]